MIKNILFCTLLLFGVCGFTQMARASESGIQLVDIEATEINIYLQGSTLHVVGAAGQDLYIYNITGVRVMSIKVDGADKAYSLNLPKGCYIVKVGNVVRKISIR